MPELLEMILTHADIKTLLRCQSVNKLFHATTVRNKSIQKTLHLQPAEISAYHRENKPVVNPLFKDFRNFDIGVYPSRDEEKWFIYLDAPCPKDCYTSTLLEASWKKMLVCQPPCHVVLSEKIPYNGFFTSFLEVARLAGPLTMGEVVEKFKKHGLLI